MALFGLMSRVFAIGMIGGAGMLMMLPLAGEVRPVTAHTRVPDPPSVPCKQQTWPNADRHCLKWTVPRAAAQEGGASRKVRVDARVVAAAGPSLLPLAPEPTQPAEDQHAAIPAQDEPAPRLRMQLAPDDKPARARPPLSVVAPQPVAATATPAEPQPAVTPPSASVQQPAATPQPATTPQPPLPPSTTIDIAFASEGMGAPQRFVAPSVPTWSPMQGFVPNAVPAVEQPREPAPSAAPARMVPRSTPNSLRHGRIVVTATAADGRQRTIAIRPSSRQDVYYYAARR